MRLITLSCVLPVGVALTALADPSLGQESQTPAERQASRVVRIACDPDELTLSEELVAALLESDEVKIRAIAGVLKLPPADARVGHPALIHFAALERPADAQPGVLIGKLSVELNHEKATAGELLESLCQHLEYALARRHNSESDRLEKRYALANNELHDAERRFAQIQEFGRELCAKAGKADLSRARIVESVRKLELQRDEAEMQLKAQSARRQALAEQIARVAQRADAGARDDPVVRELEKVVALREKAVELVKARVSQQLASHSELDGVNENVALARAQLLQQRQAAAQAAGGEILARLNGELALLEVERAEFEVRLSLTTTRLAEVASKGLLRLADEYELKVNLALPAAQQAYTHASQLRLEAKMELQSLRQPSVTIIGD